MTSFELPSAKPTGSRARRGVTSRLAFSLMLVGAFSVLSVGVGFAYRLSGAVSGSFGFRAGSGGSGSAARYFTTGFAGGGQEGIVATVVLHGFNGGTVSSLDALEFYVASPLTRGGSISGVATRAPSLVPLGVVCAYAFLSTGVPTFGFGPVPGAAGGCGATEPTLGAPSDACGDSVPQTWTVNLLTGTVTGSRAAGCAVSSSVALGATALFVSYVVEVNGSPATAELASFTILVQLV